MSIDVLKKLCGQVPWCDLSLLEPTVELALEIAREGREGRRIGTLFTLGEADAVLAASRPLILDPLAAHVPARTHITDPNLRGTIKELAHDSLSCEEFQRLRHELRVELEYPAVSGIGIDDQFAVRQTPRQLVRVPGGHHPITLAVGDENGLPNL